MLGLCDNDVKFMLHEIVTKYSPYSYIVSLLKNLPLLKIHGFMEKGNILIVDDEEDIREILRFNLENAGYNVDCASSAEEALSVLSSGHDLVLLDVMMSGMSGFRMAEVLRKERKNDVPVIFLTARSGENDLLTGFSAGGDDYIAKPFSIHEVLARVKAVMKRKRSHDKEVSEIMVLGHMRIDPGRKMVYVDNDAVTLSKKEFEILYLLASHIGRVYSREDIIDELWKDAPYVLSRTVDVHIARIRSKLGECKNYITNRSGYGYCFNAED